MKRNTFVLLAVGCLCALVGAAGAQSLVKLADPMMGTDSIGSFSHGNIYPAIALPFPMNAWAPYTQPQSDSFYYQYRQPRIRGIRQTHQPSPWMGDYANFALMPVTGKLVVNESDRACNFSHDEEVAYPSYYSVRLDGFKAKAEVTPTERAASFRFSYEEAGDSYVVLDVFQGTNCEVEIVPGENKIIGIARNNRGGVAAGFGNYFVIVFDRPFAAFGVWQGATAAARGGQGAATPEAIKQGETKLTGAHVGAFVKFDTNSNKVATCKVASSYISPEQAARNLQSEIGNATFDQVRAKADAKWDEALSRAKVEGGLPDQRRTYYSCLYRSLLFPHRFFEINEQGKPVHYSPFDGKVHDGFFYTDSGYWDTFRAAHPLINILYPEISVEIQQGMLNAFDESGWLPEWPCPGHRPIMIGDNSFSLFADAWVKGIRGFDAEKAVKAMVHDANAPGPNATGRDGAEFYNKLGYCPYSPTRGEPSVREATSKTLEYAYDDYCAAVLAEAIGKKAEAETFAKNAMNYRNVFDPKTGFVRARKADGSWVEPFDPVEWGGAFTEGGPWHWTWSVFQDVPGFIKLFGGEDAFAAKLDACFTSPNTFKPGTYRNPIHEMVEMAALNMGQYAHGNEPIHHMIYLYDYVGQPWKAQSRLRQVMALLYQATPDGLCGDEDTGQMCAWYVFSALGIYPVCPGDVNYCIGSPLFDKATIKVAGGKAFTITARDNGPQRPYIRGAELNGQSFNKTFISHGEILAGGEIMFRMTSAPDMKWATGAESRPPSAISKLAAYGAVEKK